MGFRAAFRSLEGFQAGGRRGQVYAVLWLPGGQRCQRGGGRAPGRVEAPGSAGPQLPRGAFALDSVWLTSLDSAPRVVPAGQQATQRDRGGSAVIAWLALVQNVCEGTFVPRPACPKPHAHIHPRPLQGSQDLHGIHDGAKSLMISSQTNGL